IVQIFAVRPHLFPERNQRPPFLGDKNGADLHGRFWFGFLGGGSSPLTACASNLRVTLTAAWLISSSERRPSSIRTPDFLLKVSASSRIVFTFSNNSSALPSARPGMMPSILVMALSKPAKALSALPMILSIASPLLAS